MGWIRCSSLGINGFQIGFHPTLEFASLCFKCGEGVGDDRGLGLVVWDCGGCR